MPLPPPADLSQRPAVLVGQLKLLVGPSRAALLCADLLGGADPTDHADVLPYVGGIPYAGVLEGAWDDYWARVWGARGLRYAWDDRCVAAIVGGLSDEHWRVAEMCLKVAAQREIGEAGPGAVGWIDHELPRVRAAACRALGAVGDTEHVEVVRGCLDDPHPDVRRAAARALGELSRRLDVDVDPADYV